ncbi:MAG: lipoyl(octanoyl) transferase, partial [Micavibrio sp.]|nr:lipoyl(octanoyl) transferase [Micavibrio sp.]
MAIEWKISKSPVEYETAVQVMEERVAAIRAGEKDELIWFLEHPPLYTAGTSAKDEDLLSPKFPVFETGRGGQYTYHGPGQRVAYVMLDLKKRQQTPDIKKYIRDLEQWIINTLAAFDIKGERREGRVGIWVKTPHPSFTR